MSAESKRAGDSKAAGPDGRSVVDISKVDPRFRDVETAKLYAKELALDFGELLQVQGPHADAGKYLVSQLLVLSFTLRVQLRGVVPTLVEGLSELLKVGVCAQCII